MIKEGVKKVCAIVLIIAIVIVALASFVYYIFVDDGTWKEDKEGRPKIYTSGATISGSNGITVEKSTIINQALKDKGYTDEEIEKMTDAEIIDLFNMQKKLDKKITSLDECTQAEIMWCLNTTYSDYLDNPEQLEYLLNAELVTQYPYISSLASSDDKINGVIQFDRIQTTDEGEQRKNLTYTDSSQFDTMYNNYANTGNRDVFNYFTLDEEGNAVIAVWTEESGYFESNNTSLQVREKIASPYTEEKIQNDYDNRYKIETNTEEIVTAKYNKYNIDKTKINYKSMVQQYVMPFEYLWILLLHSEEYEFVEEVAQLVYNTKITIGIFDSTTTTVNINRKEYTEDFQQKIDVFEKDTTDITAVEEHTQVGTWNKIGNAPYDYYAENKITYYYDQTQVEVIYADAWFVETTTEFTNNTTVEKTGPETTDGYSEEWQTYYFNARESVTTRTELKIDLAAVLGGNFKQSLKAHVIRTRTQLQKQRRTINRKETNSQEITYKKYIKGETQSKEKTDTDESTPTNFVKILISHQKAYDNMTDLGTLSWLIEVLENNESTANLVDLTLYLLNKATGTSDYIDEGSMNFSSIWSGIMISESGAYSSSGYDYIVDTTKSDQSIVITDAQVLKNAIESVYKGKAKTNLLGEVNTFLEMQQTYHVNAVFAIAVTQVESSCGTDFSGAIAAETHNWMSMTGSYNGKSYRNPKSSNTRTWRSYPSFREATLDFGNVIANGSYYFKAGRYSVTQIAPTYCNASWGVSVISYMSKIFNAAGISTLEGYEGVIGEENRISGQYYNSVYQVGNITYKNFKQTNAQLKSDMNSIKSGSGNDMASKGCGITAAAIVLNGYGGYGAINPATLYYDYGYSNWRTALYKLLKIPFKDYVPSGNGDGINAQLMEGKPVIAHITKSTARYKTSHHFIVLLAIEKDSQTGKYYYLVSDPGGEYKNKLLNRNGKVPVEDVLSAISEYIKL